MRPVGGDRDLGPFDRLMFSRGIGQHIAVTLGVSANGRPLAVLHRTRRNPSSDRPRLVRRAFGPRRGRVAVSDWGLPRQSRSIRAPKISCRHQFAAAVTAARRQPASADVLFLRPGHPVGGIASLAGGSRSAWAPSWLSSIPANKTAVFETREPELIPIRRIPGLRNAIEPLNRIIRIRR
jgi:hypothetical protein